MVFELKRKRYEREIQKGKDFGEGEYLKWIRDFENTQDGEIDKEITNL